jgi:uncharacterized repeat protein (TIGR02543 family)
VASLISETVWSNLVNRLVLRKLVVLTLILPASFISGAAFMAPAAQAVAANELSNLTISSGTLSPTFDSAVRTYTASVNGTSVNITPTFIGEGKTATVNGVLRESGSAATVTLDPGVNTITVEAIVGGISTSYTVTISRVHTITYELNNATSGSVPSTETVLAGSVYTVALNTGNLKRTDFRFLGWGDNATDGSGTIYRPGVDTLTITANTVLYAKWDNPYGFGLYLDKPFVQNSYIYSPTDAATALANANDYSPAACPSNLIIGTITSGSGCFVEVNGLYGGASTDTADQTVGGTGTNFFGSRSSGFTITFPTPQTYFGMWWSGGSVSDTIEFLSGTKVLATMNTSSLATLLSPSGYPIAEASNGGAFPSGTIAAPNGILYPKGYYFGKPSIYDTVTPTTFPSSYGTLSGGYSTKITTAYLYAYIHAFGQGGVTFTGVRLTGGSFEFDNMVTSSKTLTPALSLIKTDSETAIPVVIFDKNGSSSSTMESQSSTIPAALSTNTYSRPGFTFGGWNMKADGTGRTLAGGAEYSFDANTTLYAVWTPNTVTPAKNLPAGGTVTASDANSDGTWDLVATPNAGYTFSGWSCNASQTPASASSATTTVLPTANTTCTASFTAITYAVTSTPNLIAGGTVTSTDANSDGTWDLVATPNAGYTFSGWSCTASQTPTSASTATTTLVPTADSACTATFQVNAAPRPAPRPIVPAAPVQSSQIIEAPTACYITSPYQVTGVFDMPISNIAINGQVISTSLWTQASNKVTISIPTNLNETVGIQIINGASPQLPLISCSTAVTPSATTTLPATVPPTTTTPVASITADSMAFDIYYNMNSATLDSKNKAIIRAKYRELRSKLNSNAQVVVKVTGWVQPTITSPNVRGLSIWRAKSVVQYMQSLGLKAKYTIQAPGHEKLNIAQSRRASAVISWSTSK